MHFAADNVVRALIAVRYAPILASLNGLADSCRSGTCSTIVSFEDAAHVSLDFARHVVVAFEPRFAYDIVAMRAAVLAVSRDRDASL